MIETALHLVTTHIATVFNVAFSIVAIASSIAAITRTPTDDEWVAKVYRIVDVLALNVGYAKDKPKKTSGGRFVAD